MSLRRMNGDRALGILLITVSAAMCLYPANSQAQGKAYLVEEGIVFRRVGDVELQLDLARPIKGVGPFPAIVFIFGGAWGYYETHRRSEFYIDVSEPAHRGYIAVTIDYRLTNI